MQKCLKREVNLDLSNHREEKQSSKNINNPKVHKYYMDILIANAAIKTAVSKFLCLFDSCIFSLLFHFTLLCCTYLNAF